MKKIVTGKSCLSLLLALCLVLGLLPAAAVQAHAEECADHDMQYWPEGDKDHVDHSVKCANCDVWEWQRHSYDSIEDSDCNICGYVVDCDGHSFENGNYNRDAETHAKQCDYCVRVDEATREAHIGAETDDICDVCHWHLVDCTYEWQSTNDKNTEQHQLLCVCGEEEWVDHSGDGNLKCDVCGESIVAVAWCDVDADGVIDEGETAYISLRGAFEAHAENIKLATDAVIESTLYVSVSTVLDLNGHRLSNSETFGSVDLISFNGEDADLTVKNGTIAATHDGDSVFWKVADNTLTLDNVTVTSAGKLARACIYVDGGKMALQNSTVQSVYVYSGEIQLGEGANVTVWEITGGSFNVNPATLPGFDSGAYEAVYDEVTGLWTVGGGEDDEGNEDDDEECTEHTYENGRGVATPDGGGHYPQCDNCDFCDITIVQSHVEGFYIDHYCDACREYVRAWCEPVSETDHHCSNGEGCRVRLTDLCSDGDGDHICDGCRERMDWVCEDGEDGNHICNGCGERMDWVCEDGEDGDHICDGCGNKMPCNHWLETPENKGDGTHTGQCGSCGETVIEACDFYAYAVDENHHWKTCICGATVNGEEKKPHSFTDGEEGYYYSHNDSLHLHECDTCWYSLVEFHVDEEQDGICDLCEEEALTAYVADDVLHIGDVVASKVILAGYSGGQLAAVQVVDAIDGVIVVDTAVQVCDTATAFFLNENYVPVAEPCDVKVEGGNG